MISKASAITLREVTKENVWDVCRLQPAEHQKQFVAPNALSIAEGHDQPNYAWFRAIYADETPVGFVMVGMNEKEDFCFLWRFMIDEKYQKMGFGRKALAILFAYLGTQTSFRRVVTSYHEAPGNPAGFYLQMGFTPADDDADWGCLGQEMLRKGEKRLQFALM